jgi:hypothetical protein
MAKDLINKGTQKSIDAGWEEVRKAFGIKAEDKKNVDKFGYNTKKTAEDLRRDSTKKVSTGKDNSIGR